MHSPSLSAHSETSSTETIPLNSAQMAVSMLVLAAKTVLSPLKSPASISNLIQQLLNKKVMTMSFLSLTSPGSIPLLNISLEISSMEPATLLVLMIMFNISTTPQPWCRQGTSLSTTTGTRT